MSLDGVQSPLTHPASIHDRAKRRLLRLELLDQHLYAVYTGRLGHHRLVFKEHGQSRGVAFCMPQRPLFIIAVKISRQGRLAHTKRQLHAQTSHLVVNG